MSIHTTAVTYEPLPGGGARIHVHTPQGVLTTEVFNPAAPQSLTAVGMGTPVLVPHVATGAKKRLRRRSIKQEEEIAARENQNTGRTDGRRVKGSGAGLIKGDVCIRGLKRFEAKLTQKKSYTLKVADLVKLRTEAQNLEIPGFEVHFIDPSTFKAYERWLLIDARFSSQLEYTPVYATTLDCGPQ
jgi:hypothetical protein